MRYWAGLVVCLALTSSAWPGHAQQPVLQRIYFNLYTDSLKPVLNYYVNVEGEYSDGSYRPLDTTTIRLTADRGVLRGNEWLIPPVIEYDRVTFRAVSKGNPALQDTITVWIKKGKDPRDAPDYASPEEEPYGPPRRRSRR